MSERFIDFDPFIKEVQKDPLVIKLFDKQYTLPASLPASVMLRILRLQAEHEGELPPHEILFLAEEFMGKNVMEELLANNNFSLEIMGQLISDVIAVYSGGKIPHEGEGEPPLAS